MTYNPQKPRYSFPLAGKTYELEGTFGLIEAVESALKSDILSVISRCGDMPVSELSRLISTVLSAGGERISQSQVGDILWNDIGIDTTDFTLVRVHIHAFLRICVARPAEREQLSKEWRDKLGEMTGEVAPPSPSLGETTDSSV